MRHRKLLALSGLVLALFSGVATAQEEAVTRYPDAGIAILDCDPPAPAPAESCLVRVPPRYGIGNLKGEPLGDERGSFILSKPGADSFPDDVRLSANILLVDLSPGEGPGRGAQFEVEKDLMAAFVRALPERTSLAVYGFNQTFTRILDFTTDRATVLDTIDGLELDGSNTRIGTFVGDAMSVLAQQDDALTRNLILVSDGQEEGTSDVGGLVETAIEERIVISAIGTFWRPFGSAQNGAGMDYLRQLTEGTTGITAQAQLDRPDNAREAVDTFAAALAGGLRASGLILPEGDPQASTISMVLREPVLGSADSLRDVEISAAFIPAQAETEAPGAEEAVEEEPAEDLLLGYPRSYVFIAAAIAALLLLLVLIAVLRRSRRDDGDAGIAEEDDLLMDDDIAPPTPVAPEKPKVAPVAYLVFDDTGRRAGFAGDKVSIGRAASNDIVIEADSISRLHAQIYRNRDGGYSLADMDSLNGTFVNEEKIAGTQKVRLGDQIKFGKVTVKLVSA